MWRRSHSASHRTPSHAACRSGAPALIECSDHVDAAAESETRAPTCSPLELAPKLVLVPAGQEPHKGAAHAQVRQPSIQQTPPLGVRHLREVPGATPLTPLFVGGAGTKPGVKNTAHAASSCGRDRAALGSVRFGLNRAKVPSAPHASHAPDRTCSKTRLLRSKLHCACECCGGSKVHGSEQIVDNRFCRAQDVECLRLRRGDASPLCGRPHPRPGAKSYNKGPRALVCGRGPDGGGGGRDWHLFPGLNRFKRRSKPLNPLSGEGGCGATGQTQRFGRTKRPPLARTSSRPPIQRPWQTRHNIIWGEAAVV